MIESFNLITDKILLEVDLKNDSDLYATNERELVVDYFNSLTKGMQWICQQNTHSILEQGVQVTGFPAVDLLKLVVIYPSNHESFGTLSNGFLYDCFGNKLMRLELPDLISNPALEISKRTKKDLRSTSYFREVFWSTKKDGTACTAVKIDFDWEWWEVRVLNTENGNFEECLNAGRR